MSRADALTLAQAGWPVFPCKEKKPLTPNGFRDASTSVPEDWPEDAQIAIAIPPGLLVVDVDDMAALATLPPMPPTLTALSGKRGEHRWYRTNGTPTTALAQRKLAPGIDTRIGGKGYVIGPPSPHNETGKPYAWASPMLPIADAPAWMLEALAQSATPEPPPTSAIWPTPTTDAIVQARAWLANAPPSIQGQNGSGALMAAAGVLVRGFALGPACGYELLREYNQRAQPPWSDAELARAVENALHSAREPAIGSMLPATSLLHALRPTPLVEAVELDADAIFAELPPVDYLVHGLNFTHGPPAMIAGYGFSGKTTATQALAIDLARPSGGFWDGTWGRFHVGRRARVLHLDYEQGQALTRRKYQRIALAAGVQPEELRGYLKLIPYPSWYLNTSQGFAELERKIEGFDFVIVDSFLACCPGLEENSSNAREPLDACARLSEKHRVVFLFIHHARKPNSERAGGSKMAIRGSGAIFDGCSSVLLFESEDKKAPKLVHHEKEKTSGVPLDDFLMVIEDVEGGGLRVTAKELEHKTAAEKSNAEMQDDVGKIREWLKVNLFFKNREQAARAVGISNARATAAMGAMLTSGELVQSGSYRDRAYHLSGVNQ